jgi:hypothetical protein
MSPIRQISGTASTSGTDSLEQYGLLELLYNIEP